MSNQRIVVRESRQLLRVTLARPEQQNSIDDLLLHELHLALDQAERSADCRVVLLEGQDGVFCTGLDFEAMTNAPPGEGAGQRGKEYFSLLRRFSCSSRVVISAVDGRVAAGGVGLVAASDFVFASERTTFGLPEALWGLLPCCVLPFLVRRVGFQKAYAMTLSTQPYSAREAAQFQLVDEVSDDLEGQIRKLTIRLNRLHPSTVSAAKRYFGAIAGISPETEQMALAEFGELMSSRMVRSNIENFVTTRRFPWEPASS
jgi:polyketide biosynthesis enoyl-CoA hydratase PksH